mmetsp:Transcript_29355/g.57174  ORF Transcript_29355/g.57174 Transcript_29355/m.57174 type:complete len:227 (-) Transcript_29355:2082-2762(-)
MPRQQLGDRVNDDVGPMVKGLEGARGGEGVVHYQQDAGFARQRRKPQNICHTQGRVRHNLNQDHPRLWPDRGAHGGHIAGINHRGLNAQTRQIFGHHPQGAPIKLVAPDHVIACFGQSQQNRRDGAHSAGTEHTHMRGVLHPVDGLGHHIGIRVTLAAVGIAVQIALILRVQHVGRVRGIDHRWAERRHNGARGAVGQRRGPHQRAAIVFHVFTSISWSRKRRMFS